MKALSSALQAGACPHLAYLHIGQSGICSKGLTYLSLALQAGACSGLEELYLYGNKGVDDDGLASFVSAMKKQGGAPCSQTLRTVSFARCGGITSKGVGLMP